jgi:hypothetical protein
MLRKLCFCTLLLLAASSQVRADAHVVVVLGLRSVEGDDAVANDVTEQLRSAAKAIDGWTVSNAAVSMAQMSLAHGCEEIDAACLTDIAKGLHADEVIYGTIRRTSARDDYAFALELYLFDAGTGSIARQVDDTLPRTQTGFQALAARADKLLARLSSQNAGGGIEIQANVADAEVHINGQQVGTTHDGSLRLAGLQPGRYRIELRKQGYVPHVSTISVVEGQDTSIAAVLSPAGTAPMGAIETDTSFRPSQGHHLAWLGWTLIGLSAASVIGTAVSFVVIDDINTSPLYRRYKDAVARGNKMAMMSNLPQDVESDACQAAYDGNTYSTFTKSKLSDVQHSCRTASTFEVLQWVFLGTAIASGAAGTYLVLTADHGEHTAHEHEEEARLRPRLFVLPSVGPGSAHLSATLRF